VNPPSGRAQYQFPNCDASLEDFAEGTVGRQRDWKEALRVRDEARRLQHTDDAESVIKEARLHPSLLENPMFSWPLLTSTLFAMVPADPLHLCLFYFKVLVIELARSLTPAQRAQVERRIEIANEHLLAHLRLSPLQHTKNWNGHEARSFGLLVYWLLDGLAQDDTVLTTWGLASAWFALVYSPEVTPDLALAVDVGAVEMERALLQLYPANDGNRRKQLNMHSPRHVGVFLREYGPSGLWDTEAPEHAQHSIARFAKHNTREVTGQALRTVGAWQAMAIERVQHDPASAEALAVREARKSYDAHIVGSGTRSHVVVAGAPLVKGAVVCVIGNTEPRRNAVSWKAFPKDFYRYYVVEDVAHATDPYIDVSDLAQPKRSLMQFPFDFAPLPRTKHKLPLSQLHRVIAKLPKVTRGATVVPSSWVVVPTRSLVEPPQ